VKLVGGVECFLAGQPSESGVGDPRSGCAAYLGANAKWPALQRWSIQTDVNKSMAVGYSLIMTLYIYTSTTRPRQLLRRRSDRAPSLAAFLADFPSSHAGGQGKGWIYFHQTLDGVPMSQFAMTELNLPLCETFTSSITHDLTEPGQATEI